MRCTGNTLWTGGIVGRTGYGISGRIQFEITCSKFDRKDLSDIQKTLGYHPMGYDGPFGVAVAPLEHGGAVVRWTCSASCD